jgi:tetratricopeptide (TPR) repeat protein
LHHQAFSGEERLMQTTCSEPLFCLRLCGPFGFFLHDGSEISIRATKNRGLVALLALAPEGRRSRNWLQDKLWSDRGREQAAASLRQALAQLRDDLGTHDYLLSTTREMVKLDLSLIDVKKTAEPGSRAQFLEGIDVRDPEFEAWLRAERLARALPTAEAGGAQQSLAAPELRIGGARPLVYLVPEGAPRSTERFFEEVFIDCLERSIAETLPVDLHRRAATQGTSTEAVQVVVQSIQTTPTRCSLRVRVEEARTGRVFWTGMRIMSSNGAPPVEHHDVLSLTFEATEALADMLLLDRIRRKVPLDAALMGRIAIRKIFTMAEDSIRDADALLAEAFEIDPHPNFLAWQIQLRVIQRMERHSKGWADGPADLGDLMARAMALDPSNSMVLAACANARLLVQDDVNGGTELARASLRMNSANPFAWDCLSIGLLLNGALEEAHRHQLRANEIASRFPIRHFWEMGACLTSVVTGRNEQAVALASAASALAPAFRPPLRYLAALEAVRGNRSAAIRHAQRLRELEPDFSFARMVEDGDYPVAALRRSGILSTVALRALKQDGL